MPEPLTICTATWTAINAALDICLGAHRKLQGLKNAPNSVRRLSNDLKGTYTVLGALQTILKSESNSLQECAPAAALILDMEPLIENCIGVFTEISTVTNRFLMANGTAKTGFGARFNWDNFKKDDINSLRASLDSCKMTLQVSCSALTLISSSRVCEELKLLREDIKAIRLKLDTQDAITDGQAEDDWNFQALVTGSVLSTVSVNESLRDYLENTNRRLESAAAVPVDRKGRDERPFSSARTVIPAMDTAVPGLTICERTAPLSASRRKVDTSDERKWQFHTDDQALEPIGEDLRTETHIDNSGIVPGILTAAALKHHHLRSDIEGERKKQRSKTRNSRSRSNVMTETADEAYQCKLYFPPMPLASHMNDSELTHDAILTAHTTSPVSSASAGSQDDIFRAAMEKSLANLRKRLVESDGTREEQTRFFSEYGSEIREEMMKLNVSSNVLVVTMMADIALTQKRLEEVGRCLHVEPLASGTQTKFIEMRSILRSFASVYLRSQDILPALRGLPELTTLLKQDSDTPLTYSKLLKILKAGLYIAMENIEDLFAATHIRAEATRTALRVRGFPGQNVADLGHSTPSEREIYVEMERLEDHLGERHERTKTIRQEIRDLLHLEKDSKIAPNSS